MKPNRPAQVRALPKRREVAPHPWGAHEIKPPGTGPGATETAQGSAPNPWGAHEIKPTGTGPGATKTAQGSAPTRRGA